MTLRGLASFWRNLKTCLIKVFPFSSTWVTTRFEITDILLCVFSCHQGLWLKASFHLVWSRGTSLSLQADNLSKIFEAFFLPFLKCAYASLFSFKIVYISLMIEKSKSSHILQGTSLFRFYFSLIRSVHWFTRKTFILSFILLISVMWLKLRVKNTIELQTE